MSAVLRLGKQAVDIQFWSVFLLLLLCPQLLK
jgi:hypothetical protein